MKRKIKAAKKELNDCIYPTYYNDRIKRIQIGRYKEVPIEDDNTLWFLWIYNNGDWDADTIANWRKYIDILKKDITVKIFCVWHGQYRTNLFLMDKKDLIKRLKKFENG